MAHAPHPGRTREWGLWHTTPGRWGLWPTHPKPADPGRTPERDSGSSRPADDRLREGQLLSRPGLQEVVVAPLRRLQDVHPVQHWPAPRVTDRGEHRLTSARVIEAAGTAGAVERALGLARRGGRVVLVGLAGNDVTAAFAIDDAVNNDLLISASFAYTSVAFAEVTGLLSSGQIRPAPLITHRFPLEAYEQAYQVLRSGSGPRGKVMLEVSEP